MIRGTWRGTPITSMSSDHIANTIAFIYRKLPINDSKEFRKVINDLSHELYRRTTDMDELMVEFINKKKG